MSQRVGFYSSLSLVRDTILELSDAVIQAQIDHYQTFQRRVSSRRNTTVESQHDLR